MINWCRLIRFSSARSLKDKINPLARRKTVSLQKPFLIPSDTSLGAQQEEKKKRESERAFDGTQPFVWPHGRLREEGRRQVDIWAVCYCEFQILWLSPTLNLLEFFNLEIPATVDLQFLKSLHVPLSVTSLLTTSIRHTDTHMLQDSLFRKKGKLREVRRGGYSTLQIPGPGSGFVLMSVCMWTGGGGGCERG